MPAALAIVLGGVDITTKVDMTSVTMSLAGSQEVGTCDFDIVDEGLTVAADAESTLTVTDVGAATVLFGGFTRSPRVVLTSTGRLIHIKAVDFNSLLDRSIVVSDSRAAGESDHTRLVYLMTTYGTQFSSDYTQIATLNASLPAQKFIAITLRQAIERVLGQASTKSSYYVDATGRLCTYDRSVPVAAPFNIRVATPGVGEISPDDFAHDRDTDNLANAIYVVGATAAGSGWFTDVGSIATYGRRERFFNAPDSDTHAKALQVGLAVLEDQKDPVPRVTFTTQSPNDGWRIGQSTTVNSAQDNLVNESLRIAKVTTRYLNGLGAREYAIELGAPQRTLSALLGATHGGGGGFPWHSPGGAGGWSFPIGSGSTGGGVSGGGSCACNTPYACGTNDTFTRTVVNGWGSSDELIWTPPTNTLLQVNGSRGTISNNPVASGGQYAGAFVTTELPTNMDARDVYLEFQMSAPLHLGGGGADTDQTFSIKFGLALFLFVWGNRWEIDDGGGSSSTVSFSPGTTMCSVRINAVTSGTTTTTRAKIWTTGTTEPGWQATYGLADSRPYDILTIDLGLAKSAFDSPKTVYIDNVDVLCSPAGSGTPYPWTNLGQGNNSRTAWTATTPFRPGSLEVRVGATPTTPINQVPSIGAFETSFPPGSAETVWGKWVAA